MSTISLTYTVVTNPDLFVGFQYYVKAGEMFDADVYAEAYKLKRTDIDADHVLAAQDAAAKLSEGEWLEVSHSIAAA